MKGRCNFITHGIKVFSPLRGQMSDDWRPSNICILISFLSSHNVSLSVLLLLFTPLVFPFVDRCRPEGFDHSPENRFSPPVDLMSRSQEKPVGTDAPESRLRRHVGRAFRNRLYAVWVTKVRRLGSALRILEGLWMTCRLDLTTKWNSWLCDGVWMVWGDRPKASVSCIVSIRDVFLCSTRCTVSWNRDILISQSVLACESYRNWLTFI